jgi:hypothetical protein
MTADPPPWNTYLACPVCKVTAGQACYDRQGLLGDGTDVSTYAPAAHSSRKQSTRTDPTPRALRQPKPAPDPLAPKVKKPATTRQHRDAQQTMIDAWTDLAARKGTP